MPSTRMFRNGLLATAAVMGLAVPLGARAGIAQIQEPAAQVDLMLLYARDLGLGDSIASAELPDAAESAIVLAVGPAVDADDLGHMRGGFALPTGLSVSFGFDISTSVAGDLVQRVTLPSTNIVTGVTSDAMLSVLSSGVASQIALPFGQASSGVSVVSLANSGLTSVVTTFGGAGGISSLLQNRADNAVLQQTRAVDITITGLSQSLAQQATQNVVGRALSATTLFRH
jgi:hypothetical protein